MQKALEVGSYFLSGVMAYGELRPDGNENYHGLLISSIQGQFIAIPWCPTVPHKPGLVQRLDSINQAIVWPSNDNVDPILGTHDS